MRHSNIAYALLIMGLIAQPVSADNVRSLAWADLLPKGEAEAYARGKLAAMIKAAPHGSFDDQFLSPADVQIMTFNTVKALDGAHVKLKGFVVPLDVSRGTTRAFLLVLYFGACIHAPPPPPNQTISVVSKAPVGVPKLSGAVEITGVLRITRSQTEMGSSAYQLSWEKLAVLD